MKITKELKNATFEWDEDAKSFIIIDSNNNSICLNKIYGFALMRFIIRIAQKNFYKKILPKNSNSANLDEIENEETYEDPRQRNFDFEID